MCPYELDEDPFVWKSHMRHQPISVAAYVKDHAVKRSNYAFAISVPMERAAAAIFLSNVTSVASMR